MSDKKLTKQEALAKIEELKNYVAQEEAIEKKGYKILNRYTGEVIFESTKDTVKEAVEEANLRGAILSGADLSGANLREANLSGANLREANLYEADLSEANIGGANLNGANLNGANLSGANLRGAILSGADLNGAELQNAKFYGKGGTSKLKRNQLTDFLNALGFQLQD